MAALANSPELDCLHALGIEDTEFIDKEVNPRMSDVRKAIIATYAEWTAMSALRSGAPIKSRRDVYTALREVDFAVLFADALGPINRTTFDAWHADAIKAMIEREPRLTVGWATKIINVYLKTRVYIGAQGRHHLREMIHPGLWLGLERRFLNRPDILERTHCVRRIKDIVDYECIIDGCRAVATVLKCELIEVEQLWAGTEFVASA
jgi:hypothetical protein